MLRLVLRLPTAFIMIGIGILGREAEVDFIISLMGTLGRPVEVAFIKFGITPGTRLVAVDRMISGINNLGLLADVAYINPGITRNAFRAGFLNHSFHTSSRPFGTFHVGCNANLMKHMFL